jgi:predicted phosphodiesterase
LKLTKSRSPDGRPLYRLEVDGPIAIPGDVHIPFHDPIALSTFIEHTGDGDTTLLILGDLFDNYALSTFPKSQAKLAKYTLRKEVEVAEKWINRLEFFYKKVVYLPGNHEERWNRLVGKNPALDGMAWWWPLRDIIPPTWSLLDVDSRIELRRGGHRFQLEHGDKASRNSSYVSADKLTGLYPGQVSIIGHNHRLAAHHRTHWINGKPVESHAYSVGHLSDIGKLGYVSAPDWQKGGMLIRDNSVQLLSIRGEKVLWL